MKTQPWQHISNKYNTCAIVTIGSKLLVILAVRLYSISANHTSNMGIKPIIEAEVTTIKTIDKVVVHLIANRIE